MFRADEGIIRSLQIGQTGFSTIDEETAPLCRPKIHPGEGLAELPLALGLLLISAALHAALGDFPADVPDPAAAVRDRIGMAGDGEPWGHAEAVADAVDVSGMCMRHARGQHVQGAYLHLGLRDAQFLQQRAIAFAGAQHEALRLQAHGAAAALQRNAVEAPVLRQRHLHVLGVDMQDAVAVRLCQQCDQRRRVHHKVGEPIECS